jgi:sulfite dehydrogenase (cytochrome) subunit B
MKHIFLMLLALSLVFAMDTLYAQDKASPADVHSIALPDITTALKPGPGMEKTSGLCTICHSLDYITMQPPFPRAQWTATVNKMIKVMGAPINEEDSKTIIDYLSTEYGNGK